MKRLYHDIDWLREEFVVKRRTLRSIAAQCGVTKQAVSLYVVRHALVAERVPLYKLYADKEWLEQEYVKNRRTSANIAEECGVHVAVIVYHSRKHNLRRIPYTPEEVRERERVRQNAAYASDPEYRAMKISNTMRWREQHPEEYKAYQRTYGRANYAAHREERRTYQRERHRRRCLTEPGYRERRSAYAREWRRKKRGKPSHPRPDVVE